MLSALLLLHAQGRLTGRERAERLEMSERTVHRDMEALSCQRASVRAARFRMAADVAAVIERTRNSDRAGGNPLPSCMRDSNERSDCS